jgi:hypothetical protein
MRLNELSGQPLALVQPHMMRAEYEIRQGDAVAGTLRFISYRMNQVLRLSGEMDVHPEAARRPELPWLALLGWYLAVMMYRDSVFSGS